MSDSVLHGADGGTSLQRLLDAHQAITGSLTEMPPSERLVRAVLEVLCDALGCLLAVAWMPARDDNGWLQCLTAWTRDAPADLARLGAERLGERVQPGEGLAGRAWARRETCQEGDDGRTAIALPLLCGEETAGVLELFFATGHEPAEATLAWLQTINGHVAQYLLRCDAHRILVERDRALAATGDGIVIADATRRGFPIVYINPGFERLTGYTAPELLGRSCAILQGDESDPAVVREIADALADQREVVVTLRNYRKDGRAFWNELRLSPVFDSDGALAQYIGVQHDVTTEHEAMERVTFLASHDPLTGLANRSLLHKVLERGAERSRLQGTAVGLISLDLDRFKELNDRHGHLASDGALRHVADKLRTAVGSGDLVARQGGDEFLVVLSDLAPGTARATVLATAERVRAAVSEPVEVGAERVSLRGSVGVSVLGEDAADVGALMRHADAAMYRAKRTGRGVSGYLGADDGPVAAPATATVSDAELAALDHVLARRQVRSAYQPIVDLRTRAVVAYEALARGPEASPVARPDRLFAAARAANRLGELDWTCWAAAIEGALEAPKTPRTVFVNVEPEALGTSAPAGVAPLVRRAEAELDVVVEITERALTARPAELLALVEAARARGWGIALDDVGADIRSLALMPLLRPDVIKLDLRLVQEQPTTEVAEIVHAVAAERERTGAVILAEGIETEAHLQTALALGATVGQGWLFGRPEPLPAELAPVAVPVGRATPRERVRGATPYDVVSRLRGSAAADKRLLLSISMNLEQQAAALGECGVILSAFQTTERFTRPTRRRYTLLASDAAFVGALGVGLDVEPAPGVRGAPIPEDDPLEGEWSVVVLGPHFAAALVAVDLGDEGPEMDRRFEFALTYDRDLVIDAAATLMGRILPLGAA